MTHHRGIYTNDDRQADRRAGYQEVLERTEKFEPVLWPESYGMEGDEG